MLFCVLISSGGLRAARGGIARRKFGFDDLAQFAANAAIVVASTGADCLNRVLREAANTKKCALVFRV